MSTGVYNKTAGDLINDALRTANITGTDMPVEESDFANGFTCLNDVLFAMQAEQIHIWTETEAFLPMTANTQVYTLGVSGDHCFTDYKYTTVSVIALSGATTIDVGSTAGMTAGDNIGIELDDGTRQWTTIDTVTDSDTLVLDAALTDDVSVGATIYTYTTGIDQPVRILSARYADSATTDEMPSSQISRDEYFNQPSKSTTGAMNSWYYSRQLSAGKFYVWPVAANVRNLIRFTFIKPQYIPEDQSENILIPPEWYLPLKLKVAAELGLIYRVDPEVQVMLEQKAQIYMDKALGIDSEFSSFSFHPCNN